MFILVQNSRVLDFRERILVKVRVTLVYPFWNFSNLRIEDDSEQVAGCVAD